MGYLLFKFYQCFAFLQNVKNRGFSLLKGLYSTSYSYLYSIIQSINFSSIHPLNGLQNMLSDTITSFCFYKYLKYIEKEA